VTDLGAFGPVLGGPPTPTDLATLRLVVDQQRGLVTRQQCLAAGITYRAVRHRLDTGRWTRLSHGVYLTVPGREGWWWQATSALLSVGSGAAWAFGTAGFAHGLVRTAPTTVELVVDAAIHVRAGLGIRVHRSRYADQRVDELHWPWRTRFEETVLDLAERGSTDEVLALLGRAFFRGQTTEATLRSLLEARARHRGRRLLTDVLADVADGAQSAMEVRFLQDVERAHGLPRGRRQAPSVAGRLRLHDVAYDEQRVLVELDGRLGHVGEGRISDGRRDRRSAGQGWLTLRAFWIDVAGTPARQLARWPRS
jgi:very-short-patch-repair endonuclease